MNYPLKDSGIDIKSKSGKSLKDITIDQVINGKVTGEDIKISKETLKLQGEIARKEGRTQLSENFERASELVDIPDEELLIIYNMLRPYRSTKEELELKAKELIEKYNSISCSKLILDAVNVYNQRGILKK